MDQNAPNGAGKGSWREKLGIGSKDLPRISDQFKELSEPEPKPVAHPTVAVKTQQAVAKPAPMAPRPGAAKVAPAVARQPAPSQAEGAFADRLKAQRDAAERLAEQRVAAARQRAEVPIQAQAPPPVKNGNGAAKPAERPKFSFADDDADEGKDGQAHKPPSSGVVKSASVIPPLPPKSAKPGADAANTGAAPKLPPPLIQAKPQGLPGLKPNVLPPTQHRGIGANPLPPIMPPRPQLGTAMPQPGFKLPLQQAYPYDYKSRGPMPPAYQPPAGQQPFRAIDPPGFQRQPATRGYQPPGGYQDPAGLAARREAYESYRRQPPPGEPEALDDQAFAEEPALGAPPRRAARPLGPPGRMRGQAYDDDGGEVFEDEAPVASSGRRRASAQDYSRAYREYEEHDHDEPRRSLWPWILMLALLVATAVALAGGWYYMNYLRNPVAGTSGADVPVIEKPVAEDKSRGLELGGSDKTPEEAAGVVQPEIGTAKKKLIYDRILGDQSIEGNAIVPTEEPPVAPAETGGQTEGAAEPAPLPVDPAAPSAAEQDAAGEGATDEPPAAAGQSQDPAVPDPLPVPPPPGGNGQQGAQDGPDDVKAAEVAPAAAPPDTEEQAAAVIDPKPEAAKPAGEALVLNGQPKAAEEIRTRSFGVTQGAEEPDPIVDAGKVKPPVASIGEPQPAGDAEVKQAAIPPPGGTDEKAEAVDIKPPESGAADGKQAALESPEADGDDAPQNGDGAVEEPQGPPAKAVDEPAGVKKPGVKQKSVSKKPKQKAAAKTPKKKAKSTQEETASTDAVSGAAAASSKQTENIPIGDGPLESAEAAPPPKKKSGSFFDLFRRKNTAKDPAAEQKVASAEPAAKKKADPVEPAAASGFGVQLGTFRTEAEARAEVNRLKAKHGGKMAGMSARVSRTQVAGSTRFGAGFSGADSRAAASQVCSQLLAAGERDCVVRRQ